MDEEKRDEQDEQGEERPRITLDRYMAQRHRTAVVSWVHITALVLMLATLVMLLLFKDRCGRAVSGVIFQGSQDGGPAVKLKTQPGPKTK